MRSNLESLCITDLRLDEEKRRALSPNQISQIRSLAFALPKCPEPSLTVELLPVAFCLLPSACCRLLSGGGV